MAADQKKGHPTTSCPEAEKGSDNASSSSWYSQVKSITKLTKDFKKMGKYFTHLQQLQESDSDLSDDDDEDEALHLQIAGRGFQFTPLKKEFKPHIAKLFNPNNKLDLREIILLDSQSKMDLLCNPALISETFKSRRSMQLKSNSETVVGNHKEKMAGYHKNIWFSKRAITNIIALSNIIHKYRVTYNNEYKMFIFQREVEDKPNMEFRIHKSEIHYYDLR